MVKLMKGEKGFTLIEVVIAIAILGIIAAAFMAALAGASRAIFVADERATAESLARSQMEDVKELDYADNYTASIPLDYVTAGYSANISAQRWDAINHAVSANETGIQKITVTVGHNSKPAVITLVDYKARRY